MLTSSTDTIEKHIRLRNRPHERVEEMVRRFRLIDAEFRRLAPLYPNTVVIDRDRREFHDRAGLRSIVDAAGLPPFAEIPYRRWTASTLAEACCRSRAPSALAAFDRALPPSGVRD